MFFINNFIDNNDLTIYWSIAIEFQMYLFSPLLMKYMYNSKRPWALFIPLCIIGTIVGYCILFLVIYPADMTYDEKETLYGVAFYAKPYCRFTPYLFGMLAAYYHRSDNEINTRLYVFRRGAKRVILYTSRSSGPGSK